MQRIVCIRYIDKGPDLIRDGHWVFEIMRENDNGNLKVARHWREYGAPSVKRLLNLLRYYRADGQHEGWITYYIPKQEKEHDKDGSKNSVIQGDTQECDGRAGDPERQDQGISP